MKQVKVFFVITFLSLLCLPLINFNFKGEESIIEKRKLNSFPIVTITNILNSKFYTQIDNYLNDRLGFKTQMIELNANIKYKILKDAGNDRALVGKDRWLFYIQRSDGDNYNDFLKNNLVNEDEIAKFVKQIKLRSEWCSKNNIQFIFLITPNKHSIYSEFYPIKTPSKISRTDQFLNSLNNNNIDYIYPRDLLLSKKDSILLYYKTDTHWNENAGFYTFDELLLPEIVSKFPDVTFTKYEYNLNRIVTAKEGGIVPLLGLKSYNNSTFFIYIPKKYQWSDIYSFVNFNNGNKTISINKNTLLPKALIFHDSFFNTLQPFTSTMFSEAEYKNIFFEETDKEYILHSKPDLIIWEVVERYIDRIPNSSWKE